MPPRCSTYRLSRRAERDLEAIYLYSVKHWSLEQADRYINDIRTALIGLVQCTRFGRRRTDVSREYWSYTVGSHIIFYKEAEDLLVVRILHTAMDYVQHLTAG